MRAKMKSKLFFLVISSSSSLVSSRLVVVNYLLYIKQYMYNSCVLPVTN